MFMDHSAYAAVVAEQGARVCAVAAAGGWQARVPHMKRWKLVDVVAHLGGVHRWAAEIVTTGAMTRSHRRGRDTGEALLAWFEAGLANLVTVLSTMDPDRPCPNFSPGSPRVAGFWARRQAHETIVHRWDAEATAGPPSGVDPLLAADGVDEVLHVFTRTRGGRVLPAPVALRCADTGSGWIVSPAARPGRVVVARAGQELVEPVATRTAPAESLLLALWGRRPVPEAELVITGRQEVARSFLAGPTSS
jgi:uncharacterized protein (TIGR03083 family)